MLTTITVNGTEGLQFLARLHETSQHKSRPVPPALKAMIEHLADATSQEDVEQLRLEVAAPLAEEIAAYVEDMSEGRGIPLLFSAQIGDLVVLVRDVLAESHVGKREARTWHYVPGGTVARLVGHRGDLGKLQVLDGPMSREYVYVSDRCTTRARHPRS